MNMDFPWRGKEAGLVWLGDPRIEKTFKDDERMGYMTADEYISKVVDGS